MPAWAPMLILGGVLLAAASERLTARIVAHRPDAEPRVPLVVRGTVMVAGLHLVALGFAGL